jgi:hypothetical protein
VAQYTLSECLRSVGRPAGTTVVLAGRSEQALAAQASTSEQLAAYRMHHHERFQRAAAMREQHGWSCGNTTRLAGNTSPFRPGLAQQSSILTSPADSDMAPDPGACQQLMSHLMSSAGEQPASLLAATASDASGASLAVPRPWVPRAQRRKAWGEVVDQVLRPLSRSHSHTCSAAAPLPSVASAMSHALASAIPSRTVRGAHEVELTQLASPGSSLHALTACLPPVNQDRVVEPGEGSSVPLTEFADLSPYSGVTIQQPHRVTALQALKASRNSQRQSVSGRNAPLWQEDSGHCALAHHSSKAENITVAAPCTQATLPSCSSQRSSLLVLHARLQQQRQQQLEGRRHVHSTHSEPATLDSALGHDIRVDDLTAQVQDGCSGHTQRHAKEAAAQEGETPTPERLPSVHLRAVASRGNETAACERGTSVEQSQPQQHQLLEDDSEWQDRLESVRSQLAAVGVVHSMAEQDVCCAAPWGQLSGDAEQQEGWAGDKGQEESHQGSAARFVSEGRRPMGPGDAFSGMTLEDLMVQGRQEQLRKGARRGRSGCAGDNSAFLGSPDLLHWDKAGEGSFSRPLHDAASRQLGEGDSASPFGGLSVAAVLKTVEGDERRHRDHGVPLDTLAEALRREGTRLARHADSIWGGSLAEVLASGVTARRAAAQSQHTGEAARQHTQRPAPEQLPAFQGLPQRVRSSRELQGAGSGISASRAGMPSRGRRRRLAAARPSETPLHMARQPQRPPARADLLQPPSGRAVLWLLEQVVYTGTVFAMQAGRTSGHGEDVEDQECSVCLDCFKQKQLLRRYPGCGHCFHERCIEAWLTRGDARCPLCRWDPVKEAW